MISQREIGWVAGIIEGEGCIIATEKHTTERVHRQLRLAVEMCDLDVLIKLKKILGPTTTLRERKSINSNPKWKRRYILCLCGTRLISWLMTIYPLMSKRRKQKIKEAIKLWKIMRKNFILKTPRKTKLRVREGKK